MKQKRFFSGALAVFVFLATFLVPSTVSAQNGMYSFEEIMQIYEDGTGVNHIPSGWESDPNAIFLGNNNGSNLKLSKLDEFDSAVRLEMTQPGTNAWDPQFMIKLADGMKKDDMLFLTFKMRQVSDDVKLSLRVRADLDDSASSLNVDVLSGKKDEWIQVFVPLKAKADSVVGKGRLIIQFGTKAQTVDIADVNLISFGNSIDESDFPVWDSSQPIVSAPSSPQKNYNFDEAMDLVKGQSYLNAVPEKWAKSSNVIILNDNKSDLKSSVIKDYKNALHLSLNNPGNNTWDPQMLLKLDSTIEAGDTVFWGFKVRANTDSNSVKVRLRPDGATSLNLDIGNLPKGKWVQVYVPMVSPVASKVGDGRLVCQFGETAQSVDFADIFAVSFGKAIDVSQLPTWDAQNPLIIEPEKNDDNSQQPENDDRYTFEEALELVNQGKGSHIITNDWTDSQNLLVENGTEGKELIITQLDLSQDMQTSDNGLRLQTTTAGVNNWTPQLTVKIESGISKGDTILFGFKMRGVESITNKESTLVLTNSRLRPDGSASVNLNAEGYISENWQQFFMAAEAPADSDPNNGTFVFHLGMAEQTIEISDLFIISYGKNVEVNQLPIMKKSYEGMEDGAKWRKDAEKRIEEIRKADLTVNLKDEKGNNIEGATVKIEQKRHSFGFGTIVNTDTYEQLNDIEKQWYLDTVKMLSNRSGFENDLKMNFITQGKYQQQVEFFMDWFKENDIDIRGHVLIYGDYKRLPLDKQDELKKNPQLLKEFTLDHIDKFVTKYKDYIYNWDVVNENMTSPEFTNALGNDVIIDWFKQANKADPNAKLTLNDFGILSRDKGHQDYHYNLAKYLVDNGAPITTIGIQGHVQMLPPEEILKILDRFASLGKEIEITEFTFDEEDEELQALYTKDFLTAIFSHQSTTSLVSWGFWEGSMYEPGAAMFRQDFSMKPNGEVWMDLIYNQWWTNESGATNANGDYNTRGFLGEHEISVEYNGTVGVFPVSLNKSGESLNLVLKNGEMQLSDEKPEEGNNSSEPESSEPENSTAPESNNNSSKAPVNSSNGSNNEPDGKGKTPSTSDSFSIVTVVATSIVSLVTIALLLYLQRRKES